MQGKFIQEWTDHFDTIQGPLNWMGIFFFCSKSCICICANMHSYKSVSLPGTPSHSSFLYVTGQKKNKLKLFSPFRQGESSAACCYIHAVAQKTLIRQQGQTLRPLGCRVATCALKDYTS
uniref:Uncharacterized protein n=1 Tax=Micrurus surinamensis TaxID=129470 RepID=A0A2D4P9A4_MICSU